MLAAAIPGLEAEADLRALQVTGVGANPGERGQAYADLHAALREQAHLAPGPTGRRDEREKLIPGVTPGVGALADGDAALQELRAKREKWFAEHGSKTKTGSSSA